MRTAFLITLLMMVIMSAKAQIRYPVTFVQNQFTAISYNPGFAGSVSSPRLSLSAQTIKHTTGYFLSYDQYAEKLPLGIGLFAEYRQTSLNHDSVQSAFFRTGLCLAPKFTINDRLTVSPSASVVYKSRADGYYITEHTTDSIFAVYENTVKQTSHQRQADFMLGLLFNSRSGSAGLVFSDFVKTDFLLNNTYLSTVLHGQTSFAVKRITILPSFFIKTCYRIDPSLHKKWGLDQIQLSTNLKYRSLLAGIGINNTGYFGSLGFNTAGLKIVGTAGTLHDPLSNDHHWMLELSCSYQFKRSVSK